MPLSDTFRIAVISIYVLTNIRCAFGVFVQTMAYMNYGYLNSDGKNLTSIIHVVEPRRLLFAKKTRILLLSESFTVARTLTGYI
jgi:hypothetical protein